MILVSAYAPPSFLRPVLTWTTCNCDESLEGRAHVTGRWVDALDCSHALALLYSHHEREQTERIMEHPSVSEDFSIAELPVGNAVDLHVEMSMTMENGKGQERWQEGYESYMQLWRKFGNLATWVKE